MSRRGEVAKTQAAVRVLFPIAMAYWQHDQKTTLDVLRTQYGTEVAEAVEAALEEES